MKIWYFILLWLITRFILGAFNLDDLVYRITYFISNDLFMIAFFSILLQTENNLCLKRLYFAGLYYSIGMLLDNIFLFAGIGDVSKWYYETALLFLTITGYVYGNNVDKFYVSYIRDHLGFLHGFFIHR